MNHHHFEGKDIPHIKLNSKTTVKELVEIYANSGFNARQLGVTKARNEESKIEPHMDRIAEYVGKMWKEINGVAFDKDERSMRSPSAIWSKARAGELGTSIHAITNPKVKQRVIQNLFEAAGSISYVTGLNKEEQALEMEVGMDPTPRKTNFNASVYVKVF